MDPTRPHKRRPTDILFVGVGILVAVLLVLWAFFG
ncbi:MAG: putative nucleic acid-binding Zn ribbon protein [Candidatus Aldehydirespiratoraceae bacterium]|jgi:predicted nucleic acid-binding Zn ribbon protein